MTSTSASGSTSNSGWSSNNRTRTKSRKNCAVLKGWHSDGRQSWVPETHDWGYYETIHEVRAPGDTVTSYIKHRKMLMPMNAVLFRDHYQNLFTSYSNWFPASDMFSLVDRASYAAKSPTIPWSNLLSSSTAGLTQFLAEFDEMLLMFLARLTFKFFTYEEYAYGWGPLVADLNNLFEGFNGMAKLIEQQGQQSMSSREELPCGTVIENFGSSPSYRVERISGYAIQTGRVNLKGLIPQAALDNFGLHVDANVIWDLIPLSFMVDYLLPIGDLLDNLRPSGWVRTVPFQGFTSVKDTLRVFTAGLYYSHQVPKGIGAVVKHYERIHHLGYFDVDFQSPKIRKFLKLPSFTELFNMIWMAMQLPRRPKKPRKTKRTS